MYLGRFRQELNFNRVVGTEEPIHVPSKAPTRINESVNLGF